NARLLAEEGLLAGVGTPLHELHHASAHAVSQRTRQHAEGGAGFALSVAGVHQQHAAHLVGLGDTGVDDGLLALHALVVTLVAGGFVSHGYSGQAENRVQRGTKMRRPACSMQSMVCEKACSSTSARSTSSRAPANTRPRPSKSTTWSASRAARLMSCSTVTTAQPASARARSNSSVLIWWCRSR